MATFFLFSFSFKLQSWEPYLYSNNTCKKSSLPYNHRTTEWERLEGSTGGTLGPTSLLMQGYLRAHDTGIHPEWFLNISIEGNSTNSLGNLFQCTVTHTVKKFCLIFRWNFWTSVSAFCSAPWHQWAEPCSVLSTSSLQILIDSDGVPPSVVASQGWRCPTLSALPCKRGAPVL